MLGEVGESCHDTCLNNGNKMCDNTQFASVTSSDYMTDTIQAESGAECSSTQSWARSSHYPSTNGESCKYGQDGACCYGEGVGHCAFGTSSYADGGQRFCPCKTPECSEDENKPAGCACEEGSQCLSGTCGASSVCTAPNYVSEESPGDCVSLPGWTDNNDNGCGGYPYCTDSTDMPLSGPFAYVAPWDACCECQAY